MSGDQLSADRVHELQRTVSEHEQQLKELLGSENVALISYCLGDSWAQRKAPQGQVVTIENRTGPGDHSGARGSKPCAPRNDSWTSPTKHAPLCWAWRCCERSFCSACTLFAGEIWPE